MSGDITETGDPGEFDEAKDAINKLKTKLELDRYNILCAPGNHDVNLKSSEEHPDDQNSQMKLQHYRDFVSTHANGKDINATDRYPRINFNYKLKNREREESHAIEFLLLNSCEKVTHLDNSAHVSRSKLVETLPSLHMREENQSLKIAILHHRLFTSNNEDQPVENSNHIMAILNTHEFDIVLTGHIHHSDVQQIQKPNGNKIIFAGSGTTGLKHEHRESGVQNQYSIHVIDLRGKMFQTYWRAFDPKRESALGEGAWVECRTFEKNPTEFRLQ